MGWLKDKWDSFMGKDKPLGDNFDQKELKREYDTGKIATQNTTGEVKDSVINTLNGVNCMPVTSISQNVSQNPELQNTETQSPQNKKTVLNLDVLDLSRVIDICAEIKAVEAYEEMMRKSSEGNLFQKVGGFFKRSFYRVGRDAWIETKKRDHIKEIQNGLNNGTYSEESLRQHVINANRGIEEKAFLSHEEISKDLNVPKEMQNVIDEWLDINPIETKARKQKIGELKSLLEANYPITSDLSQLESSLIRLEKAKIQGELDTIEAKLNILDIGRIEYGYGSRKKSFVVDVLSKVEKSSLPKWLKGFIQHPNTAAVTSAILTRLGIGLVAGGAALGFASGLLIPVAVGTIAGGVLAGGRARREIKDRNAQIDRRSAMGSLTGTENTDGKSVEKIKKTAEYQHSTMDLYNTLAKGLGNSDEKVREEALLAGVYYLVKHKVGREQGLNMLQYDSDKSISKQHVEMIMLFNKVFPGFVARFNAGEFFDENNKTSEAVLVRDRYAYIDNLARSTMSDRDRLEREYATKQGLIYAGVAATVGIVGGVVLHTLGVGSNAGSYVENTTPGTTLTHYPDNLEAYANVKRDFWYDNGTPSPKFDHSELMIHTDKSGSWNVTNMLGKLPFTNGHNLSAITGNNFTSGDIQAVITPKVGGPSFVLPIDANGNIQIPASMQEAFNNRDFAFLEVGKVHIDGGNINLEPIAIVKGDGSMVFSQVTENIPGKVTKEFVPGEDNWYGVPFGGNKYHHINKTSREDPVLQFVKLPEDKLQEPLNSSEEPNVPQDTITSGGTNENPNGPNIDKNPELEGPQEPIVDDTNFTNDLGQSHINQVDNLEYEDPEFINLEPRPNNYNEVNEVLRGLKSGDKLIFGTKDLGHHLELIVLDDGKYDIKRFEFGNEVSNYDTQRLPMLESEGAGLIFSKVNYPGGEYGNIKELIIYRKKEIENVSDDGDDSGETNLQTPTIDVNGNGVVESNGGGDEEGFEPPQHYEKQDIDKEYDKATSNLLLPKEIKSELVQWEGYNSYLKGEEHVKELLIVLDNFSKYGGNKAKKIISALYANGGNIWLSKQTNTGMSYRSIGAVCLGLSEGNNQYADDSKRLFEISRVTPLPDDISIQLAHELGHIVTLKIYDSTINNTGSLAKRLLERNKILRREEGNGLTPISGRGFYESRGEVVGFSEDLAEVMGLYILGGRQYAERYLDDRVKVSRSQKHNITEEDKQMYMQFLDEAYNSYVA